MANALEKLRLSTKPIHDALEKLSGVDRIMDKSITTKGYIQILINNYTCYSTVETALKVHNIDTDFSTKIKNDLAALGHIPQAELLPISFHNKDHALGAKYVLLGSQLGAAMISKALADCDRLELTTKSTFYTRPSKEEMLDWKNLVSQLKKIDGSSERSKWICQGADDTFTLFHQYFSAHPILTYED